eukprot:33205_1
MTANLEEDMNDFSLLSPSEECIFLLHAFVISPIGMVMAIYILKSLQSELQQTDDNQKYTKKAIYCAIASVFGTFLLCVGNIFFHDDLIIPWNYKDYHYHLSTVNDIMNQTVYFSAKICFYCALTFHIQSILHKYDQRNGASSLLSVCMVIISLLILILGIIYAVDDSITYSMKQTGITQRKHIYLTMYLSHEGAYNAHIAMTMCAAIDLVYFFVLIYVYITRLKSVTEYSINFACDGFNEKGIMCAVLVVFACVVFWIMSVAIALNWQIKWIMSMLDYLSDDICLYFMIVSNSQKLYYKLFGFVHLWFGKVIYGKQYQLQKYRMVSGHNASDIETEHSPLYK